MAENYDADEDQGTGAAPTQNPDLMKLANVGQSSYDSPFDRPDVKISQLGISFPSSLEYDEWEAMGKRLKVVRKGIDWMLGDWLNFGEIRYGQMYEQAQELNDFDGNASRLYTTKWIAKTFPLETRRPELTFAHHAAVASIMARSSVEAAKLLDYAEANGTTEKELRTFARATRVRLGMEEMPQLPEPPDSPEITEAKELVTSTASTQKVSKATGEIGPNVAWLDDLLGIVLQIAKSSGDMDLMMAHINAKEWATKHGYITE